MEIDFIDDIEVIFLNQNAEITKWAISNNAKLHPLRN
jgi:hypothetical protein